MATTRRAPPSTKSPTRVASKPPAKSTPAPRVAESLILHLREVVHELVERFGDVERRKMLVSDGWFAGGRAFTLVSRQGRIIVRLTDEAAQRELLSLEGSAPWQIGRKAPMRDWLQLPESMHDDTEALAAWLRRAWTLAREAPKGASTRAKKSRAKKGAERGQARARK